MPETIYARPDGPEPDITPMSGNGSWTQITHPAVSP